MALVLPISGAETRSTIYTAFSVGVTIVYIYIYIYTVYISERTEKDRRAFNGTQSEIKLYSYTNVCTHTIKKYFHKGKYGLTGTGTTIKGRISGSSSSSAAE